MIEDFQHVCITCRELERSIRFYETLGLEVIEPLRELDEVTLAQTMQLSRGHLKVVHLARPDTTSNMFIDLVQWLHPSSEGESYPKLNQGGDEPMPRRVSSRANPPPPAIRRQTCV